MINLLTKPKKLLTTLVIVVVLSLVLVNLQNSLIAVSAQALPLVVYEDHLDFGLVFPGQIRDGYFRVFYSSDGGDGDVNYRLIQKRKPLPSTHPEYPNGGDPDLPGYYRDLCPYILKISQDGEGDTESSALVGPNDLMDIWKVELEVPAILDYVAQNHTGGVVSSNGEYGCDISVDIAVPNTSICGYKFFDLDENGQFAGNDYGLSSWTINLKQFDGQVWQTIKSELTAVNGYYCFEFLNPGTYRVEEVLKPNWANTTPLSQEVTISELENLNINFGNFLPGEGPRCVDADGDSFFKFSSVFCPQGNDCNDSNPNINPAALEVCDQADNDCDGYINEGNVCNPPECSAGNQQSCSTGLPGICSGGTQTCDQAGHWGSCVQNTPAITEFCDGLDNDCDGAVDEGGVCGTECSPPGSTQACNTGAPGICSAGTQTCDQFGNWDICVQNQPPTTEVCNGADDDCDGSIDEGGVCNPPECTAGNTQSCNTGLLGICSIGTKTCDQDGFWGSCVQTNSSSEEICNGADDDCDGAIDEGGVCGNGGECTPQTTRSCNTGQPGICSPGTQTCDSQGEWGSCIQDTSTATEVCDGADNNCDGAVDEGDVCTPPECTSSNTQACNTGQPGICSAGTQTCNQSGFWGSCVQDTSATAEVCDGADNDCDGVVDEGGVCGSGGECTPQATQACSTSLAGVCAAGTQTCSQLGQWGGCIQDNPATTEVCDQADNDCDGSVDEENVCGNGGGGNGGGSGGSFLALFIHTQS